MKRCPPLDSAAVLASLGDAWRTVDVVPETGSTNADLLARAAAGEDIAGAVLAAELQTAGRGRNGRQWFTPPHTQLAFSVGIAASTVPVDGWGWLSLIGGIAAVDAVARTTGTRVGLKWPNDVIADGAKLAGLLAEVVPGGSTIVLGIGMNVGVTEFDFVAGDGLPPTSLALLGAADPDRTELLIALLDELGTRIAAWRAAGGADERTLDDYRERSATIGARVRAMLPGGRDVVGTARDVDSAGRLLVESDGDLVAVSAGDVVHLRPLSD